MELGSTAPVNSTEEINLFQLRPLEYPSRLQEIEDMDLKPSPDEIRLMEQIQRNLWVLPAETNDDNSEWTSRKTDTEFDLFGTKLDKPTDTSSPDELTKRLQALKTDIEYRAPHLSFEEQKRPARGYAREASMLSPLPESGEARVKIWRKTRPQPPSAGPCGRAIRQTPQPVPEVEY